jgi:hypothetical protein
LLALSMLTTTLVSNARGVRFPRTPICHENGSTVDGHQDLPSDGHETDEKVIGFAGRLPASHPPIWTG